MAHVLELKRLSKHFANHAALTDLSLEIAEGEFFSLLGPPGCGKTTTLRLIAGFETPTQGEILLRGQDVAGKPPYERNVSTVFQNYALFPHLTVRQNIEFGLRYQPRENSATLVRQSIEMLQLGGKEDRRPAQLSGGEKQRVALARALLHDTPIILADEPTASLDGKSGVQIAGLLQRLACEDGRIVVVVSHDPRFRPFGQRLVTLQDGRNQNDEELKA